MHLQRFYLFSTMLFLLWLPQARAHDISLVPNTSPLYNFCYGVDAFRHLDGTHSLLTDNSPDLCICGPDWHEKSPILRLNTTSAPPLSTENGTGFQDLLTLEAFCRNDIRVRLTHLAGKPSLRMANSGVDDGTVGRVAKLLKEIDLPNLLLVPEPFMAWDFSAFTRTAEIQPLEWEELAPYNVAHNSGWIILHNNIKQAKSIIHTRDSEQLLGLLAKGRSDVVVVEKWQGLQAAKQLHIQDLHLVTPPLTSRKMHIFMHRKHEELIEPISRTLRQMKQDGSYRTIYAHTLQPLIEQVAR
ncbi:substrate-binding periplasmic protein [Magnetococcus sp. PR-3]|uniref:substrate-binding periplasmic protein n=1 Tax=Magnetococcus sp. PR-3 TaxID=3120355 RepID=UPI002FCE3D19